MQMKIMHLEAALNRTEKVFFALIGLEFLEDRIKPELSGPIDWIWLLKEHWQKYNSGKIIGACFQWMSMKFNIDMWTSFFLKRKTWVCLYGVDFLSRLFDVCWELRELEKGCTREMGLKEVQSNW